jgi:hypothetical protein
VSGTRDVVFSWISIECRFCDCQSPLQTRGLKGKVNVEPSKTQKFRTTRNHWRMLYAVAPDGIVSILRGGKQCSLMLDSAHRELGSADRQDDVTEMGKFENISEWIDANWGQNRLRTCWQSTLFLRDTQVSDKGQYT